MISIENIDIFGWEVAIRGMRNPLNSWAKSDSCWDGFSEYSIGPNDLDLMKRLYNAGSDHRKFMRMINVTMDIIAPLYWWKEFDTYKVGTVTNSCSTMHKIHSKEFTLNDFSHEHLFDGIDVVDGESDMDYYENPTLYLESIIRVINHYRTRYNDTKDKKYWWQMIQLLPSSYNQKRTVQLNYEVLLNMYHARRNHKLDEWREFCKVIKELPYMENFIDE